MLQINAFLLATFAKSIRFGPDVTSSLRRYQTLATLYLYLACFTKVLCFELAVWILFPEPCPPQVIYIAAGFSLVGLLFLREGKKELAVISLLSYLHIGSYKVAFAFEQPIAALYCLFPILQAGFFTTSSWTVRLTNTLACFFQAYNHISKLLEISQSSPSPAIFTQVTTVIISSSCSIALVAASCAVQRFIESSLVSVAESNYTRSENLTKETVTAFEAQEKVLFSLSHEIRNPLTSMVGSIDYLLSSIKNTEELKILKNAKLSSEVLLGLLSNILDAAKLKSDKVEICNKRTDIEEVIHKVFTINSERLKSSEVFARASIGQNVPKYLWFDPSRLLQILINLVSNALKFTPHHGNINIYVSWHHDQDELLKSSISLENSAAKKDTATPTMKFNPISSARIRRLDSSYLNSSFSQEFSLQEEKVKNKNFRALDKYKTKCFPNINNLSSDYSHESWAINRESLHLTEKSPTSSASNLNRNGVLKVEVVDTGCGMSPADLSRLFQMFSQGTAETSAQRGTGLGLWLCKQLCQAMGGDITVRSQLDQGTSFLFYIPINNDQLFSQSQPKRNPCSDTIKALVVDDYSFNRDLHKLLLEREGVQVTLASDGKEALEKFKAKGQDYFDFVFTDVQMPEMDGFTSAKKMREWEEEHNEQKVDIYFVSGEYFNEDAVMSEFKTMGAPNETGICCLRKPVDVERLRKIVQKYKQ